MGPRGMLAVVREIQRLKSDFLSAGGATIDTPPPGDENDNVVARTVVQPDGDVLCFVDEDAYLADPVLRDAHAARVSVWFAGVERIVTAMSVCLRRLASTVALIVLIAAGQATRQSVTRGVAVLIAGSAVGVVVQIGIRLALGHPLRARRN